MRCSAIEVAFERNDHAMHVSVVAIGGNQTGLAERRRGVASLRQPTSQTAAGRIADPHMLNHLR